jgi:outer membrane protein TolC
MTLRKTLAILSLFLMSGALAQAQDDGPVLRLDLKTALRIALEKNRNVQIAREDLRTAQARVREARSGAMPQLRAQGLYVRNIRRPVIFFPDFGALDTLTSLEKAPLRPIKIGSKNAYQASLTLEQPLFLAGKIGRAIKISRLFSEFTDWGYQATELEVKRSVKEAFYGALLAREMVEINRQSMQQAAAHLDNTRKLFAQGQVSEFDTLRAWVDYANTLPVVLQAENDFEIAKNNLKNLLVLPLDRKIELVGELNYKPRSLPAYEDLKSLALEYRPELRQMEFQIRMLQQNIGLVAADRYPQLYLSGNLQTQAQSNRFDTGTGFITSLSASLRLQFPVFDGFRISSLVQQAKVDYNKARRQYDQLRDAVSLEVKSILLTLQQTEQSLIAQRHNIRQAERALEIAEVRYREGAATQLEVGDARLALNLARRNYAQTVFNYELALAQLERATGQQVAERSE